MCNPAPENGAEESYKSLNLLVPSTGIEPMKATGIVDRRNLYGWGAFDCVDKDTR